jgi:hypothetical protein
LEQFKNHLKGYLEALSNQPTTRFNNDGMKSSEVQSSNLDSPQSTAREQVNFLPRELLQFLNFDLKFIDDVMAYQEQKMLPMM